MGKEQHWAFFIKQIYETLKKYSNSQLSDYNLTVAQVVVLMNLYDAPDRKLTMKELEKALGVAQSTTVGIVTRLEEKGFVEKFDVPYDKRIKGVRITSMGLKYCTSSEECMYEGERFVLSSLTAEEKHTFCQLLEKICNHI